MEFSAIIPVFKEVGTIPTVIKRVKATPFRRKPTRTYSLPPRHFWGLLVSSISTVSL